MADVPIPAQGDLMVEIRRAVRAVCHYEHEVEMASAALFCLFQARCAPSSTSLTTPSTYWMIERNSKHKHMPPNEPVLWFKERLRFAQGDKDIWTPHAHKARHFQTKAEAEEYVKKSLTGDDYDPAPDVTDHMDCNGPIPESLPPSATASAISEEQLREVRKTLDYPMPAKRGQGDSVMNYEMWLNADYAIDDAKAAIDRLLSQNDIKGEQHG